MVVSLRELTDGNRAAVLALRVAPEQEKFVGASVQNALADAANYPTPSRGTRWSMQARLYQTSLRPEAHRRLRSGQDTASLL